MEFSPPLAFAFEMHWPVWMVTIVLVVAAVIDGWMLKVPNWLTFPLVITGWILSALMFGWAGLGYSLLGTAIGLGLLLPLYAIGGMGAGDVKLLAGVGAWMYVMQEASGVQNSTAAAMCYAFAATALAGAVLSVGMVLWRRSFRKHTNQFWMILGEILTIRDPNELSSIAANRKSSMLLLPYGIPIAIGVIGYFAWTGMLV